MTPLERRYRRVVRLLPADYRAVWEEDMVDTFLLTRPAGEDDFDAEYGRPGWAEVASVVALAVRLRLDGSPSAFARGEVVRRVALVGLLVHAVAAVVGVVSPAVSAVRFPEYRASDPQILWSLSGLLWVGAFLALLDGRRRVAVWLGVVAAMPTAVTLGMGVAVGGVSVESAAYRLLVTLLPVLALVAFHRDAPSVRARPWLVALPVGAPSVTGLALATQTTGVVALDWADTLCLAVVAACVVHLVVGRRGPWSGALLVLAVVVLGERLITLVDYVRFTEPGPWLSLVTVVGLAEAVAVVLVAAPLVVRRLARR